MYKAWLNPWDLNYQPQLVSFVYRISKVGTGWFAVLIAWCLVLDTPKNKSPETADPELPGHSAPTKGHWV